MFAEIMARIEDQVDALRGRVSGVESLMAGGKKSRGLECFVVPLGETAGPNPYGSQIHRQKVTLRFAAMVTVPGGAAASGKVQVKVGPLCDQVIAALIGWKHPLADAGTEYVAWKVLGLSEAGHLANSLEFSFDFYRGDL
jgi:hypothetical protein